MAVEIFFGAYKIRLRAVQELPDQGCPLPCGCKRRALEIPYHRDAGYVIRKHCERTGFRFGCVYGEAHRQQKQT